jgi:oligopeptide/dipeptide ABC transporter ATP-binding protein
MAHRDRHPFSPPSPLGTDEPLLSIRDLVTEFATPDGVVHAVDGVSYDVHPGETVGVVGESGSGKSVTVMSILGLIPQPPGRIVGGEVWFDGRDLLQLPPKELRKVRGKDVAMIFQDPMNALTPAYTVGEQIAEAVILHERVSKAEARARALGLLREVGIPAAERRLDAYPHQLSGGMSQRVMIAMALACGPRLLVADEPTTALDVTIQAQVLDLLRQIQAERGTSILLITHDLGVVAEMADEVVVMYGGRVVETGSVDEIFHSPRHPYTLGLLSSLPRPNQDVARLEPIRGNPPSLINLPSGCSFHPRCHLGEGRVRCRTEVPPLYDVGPGRASACHFHDEMEVEIDRVERETGAAIEGDAG